MDLFEKLLKNLEDQRLEIENLRSQLFVEVSETQKTQERIVLELKEALQKQKDEFDDLQAQYSNDTVVQDKRIEELKKECEKQKAEIQRLKKIERVLTFIKFKCLRSYIASKSVWKFRSWAALKFLNFTAKICHRYIPYSNEELVHIFPKKAKVIPDLEIKIPKQEKKKKIAYWKKYLRWGKEVE